MRIAVNEIQASQDINVASAQFRGMLGGGEVGNIPEISFFPAGKGTIPGKRGATLYKAPSITKVKVVAWDLA